MGLRNSSSVNIIRPGGPNAPSGTVNFIATYVTSGPEGKPRYVEPDSVAFTATAPNGTTYSAVYPDSPTETGVSISRLDTGRYLMAIAVGSIQGRWRVTVTTNGGYGPSTESEFDVIAIS